MILRILSLLGRLVAVSAFVTAGAELFAYDLPGVPAIPTIPAPQSPGSYAMGSAPDFPEVKMDFPIEPGPFQPNWTSITDNYPVKDSAWLRKAKFGIWVHFGPQAAGQSGDWYARRMYVESSSNTYGTDSYGNHIRDYGHPSTAGYKDLIRTWNPTALNPAALIQTYYNAGARFVMVQGVHHDQYDNWNSKYQPWNSKNLAPGRDFLGEWRDAVRTHPDMHFGVAFHHEYSWWWWQSSYRSDTTNAQGKIGVPYDGNLTTNYDGGGQWWGTAPFDLRKLYLTNMREYQGIYNGMDVRGYSLPSGIFSNHLDYARWYVTWWASRILDVIENYDPDFIYTDGNSNQPFSGYNSGLGYKSDAMQRVLAHYFNRTLERRGALDTFSMIKFNPNNKGIVNTFEGDYPPNIKTDQPWIGETPIGDWYYAPGFNYSPNPVIRYILECTSRDGAVCICVSPKPDGSLDPGSVTQLQAVGNWMNINGVGIYGSKAWLKYGEGTNSQNTGSLGYQANQTFTNADFRYTVGADGYLYAYCMTVPAPGAQLTLPSLGVGDGTLAAPVGSVALLGSNATLAWNQSATDLNITCPASMPFQTAVGFKIGPPAIIKLAAPDLVSNSTTSAIGLQWKSVSSNATYTLKRASSAAGPYATVADGLTGTSYSDANIQPGVFYYYKLSAADGATTSADSPVATGVLSQTQDWLSRDFTGFGEAGYTVQSGNNFLIRGSGADIWNTSDEFRFVYKPFSGDGTITARVESLQNTAAFAKAGVMIRESLATNSRYAVAFLTPANGIAFQQRTATGATANQVAATAGTVAPCWVRLSRSGSTITAYQSDDGITWTTMGSTTIAMSNDAYLGLSVCSVDNRTLNQAGFSNVSVVNSTVPALSAVTGNGTASLRWGILLNGVTGYRVQRATSADGPFQTIVASTPSASYIDSGLTNGTTYYYRVTSLIGGTDGADSAVASVVPTAAVALVSRATGGIALANAQKATEAAAMAFDGSTATKWYTEINGSAGWLQYQFGRGLAWRITQYQITSANDAPERDPKNWQFQGSNDGVIWTTLDTRAGEAFGSRLLAKTYTFANALPYRFYRLNITANGGGTGFPIQIAELALFSAPTDVGDKNPPVLTLPANISVDSPDSTARAVSFSVTALDAESGGAPAVCQPASGSLFPVGITTVQCAATDSAGNTAAGSFKVSVNSPIMTWRLQYFGTTESNGDAADNADPDGDGATNLQEFYAGTHPKNGTDFLRVSQILANGSQGIQLSFPSVAGKTYQLECTENLQSAAWTVLQSNINGTGNVVQLTDASADKQAFPTRFYRIRMPLN